MNYSKIIVFYFSGTGNAKTAAGWIVENAKTKNIEAQLVNISEIKGFDSIELPNDALLGFCYPTHGFNAPPLVLKFLTKFPKAKSDVFLLNTRAGMKLYKLFTPGLSGLALLLPAIILKIKGYRIKAFRPLDLPSNWISLHPGLRKNVVDSIFRRCKKIVYFFSERIFAGKRVHRGLFDLPIDLAISPIAMAYYLFGRFALAKTFFATNKCDNCGICIKSCPVNAIEIIDTRNFWTFSCESCMKCMNNCPKQAIQTAHSYTFLIWWLAFSLVPYSVIKLLAKHDLINSSWLSSHFDLLFYSFMIVFGFILVFLGYRLMHFLLRYRFFNILISYSTLTRFRFWRRYNAPQK
ncbi:MAG: EFR1 family ferrodoxin [Bacteroidales bacterium]|nr:EFR1 family ferrodoxin [Bacteroidales bacterium]